MSTHKPVYSREFYDEFEKGSHASAEEVVPLVLELVKCSSVVDVGCGLGSWLSVLERRGVSTVLGLDGDYVDRRALQISSDKFVSADLSTEFRVEKQFDLAISLEVAEHISEQSVDTYFDSLVRLAPVVLFSAAVPFQEGHHHVNEQWPEYWIGHFERRGFIAVDCLRPRIWNNERVQWWYAQNAMLFVRQDRLQSFPLLEEFVAGSSRQPLSVIHPSLFLHKQGELARLQRENEQLRTRLERISSPIQVLLYLPRVAATKIANLVGRRNATPGTQSVAK